MQENEIIKKYIPDTFKPEKHGNVVVFDVSADNIIETCKKLYLEHKLQLKTITATDERNENGSFKIFYLFGIPENNIFIAPYITLKNQETFPSLVKEIYEVTNYERKIDTFFGLKPIRHPNLQKIILHENFSDTAYPLRKDFDNKKPTTTTIKPHKFQKVEGEGIYEIPVGPVHAGIIEPGHFRFSMAGEEMVLLEAKLGYKHKGTEKLFEILPMEEKIKLSERISGDTSFTHSLAFCQAIEKLSDIEVSERVKYLRTIFSELERLANHLNDIGFIMLDTGYNFGGSNCSRMREIVMQWNERLTQSRFLRGTNTIGGINKDIDNKNKEELQDSLKKLKNEFHKVIEIAKNSSSLLNRLLGTGKLDFTISVDCGVTGVAGRALGIAHDARIEYPYAAYSKCKFDIALEEEGDVLARWNVRIKEVDTSFDILEQMLFNIPTETNLQTKSNIILRKNSYGVSITEGWRGDIVYFITTNSLGKINRVDVRDPSFLNWSLAEQSVLGNIIPDFPLINKSFNLSYSGNDL